MNKSFPKSCIDCPIFKKSLFKDFNQELLDSLASKKQNFNLLKNDVLFSQGQNVVGIFCHLDGLAKVVQKDLDGNERFSRLVLPGDTSGHRSIFIESTYKGSVQVISDAMKSCFIPKAEVLNLLASNASFAKNLVIKISTELNRSEENTISVKEKNVRSRLAYLIYQLCSEYAEKINESQYLIKSKISKKDIANLLLVANETVIRLMSEMRNEGLISYREKRILVHDIDKIKKASRIEVNK